MNQRDNFSEETPSRYVIGIDLGTTNSAVAYVDTQDETSEVRTFSVPQLVAVGQVEERETLPSFHLQPTRAEREGGALRLPWQERDPHYTVGLYARDQSIRTPGRVIVSAKSWLCHAGVDRTADLLPWHAADDVDRISPIEASARYLKHIREAWNYQFPSDPMEDQEVVLTLPASFDEVARELTVSAAKAAGLPRVVLIEEPQAAFYAWVNSHRDDWTEHVEPGQKILICDIGGGTSDFTLIRVRQAESTNGESTEREIQFHRIAVGDHLILGGDNLDLALARHLENKLVERGIELNPRQWDTLVRSCRSVKETMLGSNPPDELTVHLPASGAKLIGGGLQIPISRDEVEQTLIEGFFPFVDVQARPQTVTGFQEFGLPYAADAGVTRHLAAFLTAHRHADDLAESVQDHDPARPDLVLFNGGLFCSPDICQRITDAISSWFSTSSESGWRPVVLHNDRLDLAVARGAAYYGMVRRGEGVRIAAGLARSYYIGVNADTADSQAVCLVPGKTQPGETIDLDEQVFDLTVSEPVEFPLFVSSTRLTDAPGQIVSVDPVQMKPLPPIRTAIKTQRRTEKGSVPVTLHAKLSEIGTIDMWCRQTDRDRHWRLQFDIRSAVETDREAALTAGESQGIVDESIWERCQQILDDTFGDAACRKPAKLIPDLAVAIGAKKNEWPMTLLRRIWERLIELNEGRRISQAHEARWLNLAGYALRPGYGMSVDDWRVAETWRLVHGKLIYSSQLCQTELWILWRRISGGLPRTQQQTLADPAISSVRSLHRRMIKGTVRGDVSFSLGESAELWRLLGSLELLSSSAKKELAEIMLDLIPKKKTEPVRHAMVWAIGRIGARVPLYGPLNGVIESSVVENWIDRLMRLKNVDVGAQQFALMQLARKSNDRYRDIAEKERQHVIEWLEHSNASPMMIQLVREGGELDTEQQNKAFGDSLPTGLQLRAR